jgi:major membrane immunogen (membrane-anchored lipoprotein)
MRKSFKILVIICTLLTLLVGCGKNMKDSSQDRIEGTTFSFTAEEFKNYYNESQGLFSSKIKDFNGKLVESEYGNYYSYIETDGDYTIFATSDTDGGKLTSIEISYDGGTETKSTANGKEIQLNKNVVESFKKTAGKIFDICETTTPTEDFYKFADTSLDSYILKDSSQNLGELTASFTTTTVLSFKFKPTEKK